MATKEAIIMRQEAAQERMRKALEQLQSETGAKITPIELVEKDSLSRSAELAEKMADNLEALLKVTVKSEAKKTDDKTDDNAQDGTESQETGQDEAVDDLTANLSLQPGEAWPGQASGLITPEAVEEARKQREAAKVNASDNDGGNSRKTRSTAKKSKARGKAN